MAIYRGLQKLNPSPEDCQVKQRDDFGPNSKKILAHVEQTDWLLLCYTVCVCDAACRGVANHSRVAECTRLSSEGEYSGVS